MSLKLVLISFILAILLYFSVPGAVLGIGILVYNISSSFLLTKAFTCNIIFFMHMMSN